MSNHPCKEKAAVIVAALGLPRTFAFASSTNTQICFIAQGWLNMADVRLALDEFATNIICFMEDEDEDCPMIDNGGVWSYGDIGTAGDYDEIEWVRDGRLRTIRVANGKIKSKKYRTVQVIISDVKYKPKALE